MTVLYVVVEGQTEEAFIKSALAPHLSGLGVWTTPIIVSTKRDRDGRKHRGGGDWTKWETDIRRLLRDSRSELRVTTLFDLYGLPRNFPDLASHATMTDTRTRCERLERSMAAVIEDERFIPYLQRHEFEALVLAGLPLLRQFLVAQEDLAGLRRLTRELGKGSPEDINDGEHTSPSKRLASRIPGYDPGEAGKGVGKAFYGELVTTAVGLATLRERCPRFSEWVRRLEALGADGP